MMSNNASPKDYIEKANATKQDNLWALSNKEPSTFVQKLPLPTLLNLSNQLKPTSNDSVSAEDQKNIIKTLIFPNLPKAFVNTSRRKTVTTLKKHVSSNDRINDSNMAKNDKDQKSLFTNGNHTSVTNNNTKTGHSFNEGILARTKGLKDVRFIDEKYKLIAINGSIVKEGPRESIFAKNNINLSNSISNVINRPRNYSREEQEIGRKNRFEKDYLTERNQTNRRGHQKNSKPTSSNQHIQFPIPNEQNKSSLFTDGASQIPPTSSYVHSNFSKGPAVVKEVSITEQQGNENIARSEISNLLKIKQSELKISQSLSNNINSNNIEALNGNDSKRSRPKISLLKPMKSEVSRLIAKNHVEYSTFPNESKLRTLDSAKSIDGGHMSINTAKLSKNETKMISKNTRKTNSSKELKINVSSEKPAANVRNRSYMQKFLDCIRLGEKCPWS